MSVESQWISVPLFQKEGFSLDVPYMGVECDVCPTLEHYLWKLLGLDLKSPISVSTLRSRVRNKRGFLIEAIRTWDTSKDIQELFATAWMETIQSKEILKDYMDSKENNYYCIIPKNKQTLYRFWGWNPEIADQCENRLGILLKSMLETQHQKSTSTTESEEDMLRNTFCPDCESLLFIQQNTETDISTGEKSEVLSKCCSICGWKQRMEEDEMNRPIYVSKGQKQQRLTITDHDIEEILLDPTLPRINNIPCVNPVCSTNHLIEDEYGFIVTNVEDSVQRDRIAGEERAETIGEKGIILFADTEDALRQRIQSLGLKEADGVIEKGPVVRQIIYYRTNPDDLSYSYVCSTCKTIWSNH